MDDLVVIILTLLIAGAGVLGQMKKKKQAATIPTGQAKQPENIWDLFKEEAFPPILQPEAEYYLEEEPESIPYENEQGYKFEAKNEGGKIINKEVKPETTIINSIKEKKEVFSLRKAVIYSEILNRKYI
jgi:archaellum component FlaG (FlaF/FlaG flagellin family)